MDWDFDPCSLIDFSTFVLSLNTAALVHLGEIPDPITKRKEPNLLLARQAIETLEMLRTKTQGNLTPEEERLLGTVIYELKLKYVKLCG